MALAKGVEMELTSKHKGNIALARAISYFGGKGYYLFLPIGDNGGAIDLAVSEDGTNLYRVQCKYTQIRHNSMMKRYPDSLVWRINLQQPGRRRVDGRIITEMAYDEHSFDWLFVSTPSGDYLMEWRVLCQELGYAPRELTFGKNAEKYRIS
jgi:hypothetical protein